MTTIILFDTLSIATAQEALRPLIDDKNVFAWFRAPNGAIHDVSPREVLARAGAGEFLPSRPAIFPDLEQALDTMPVDDPHFLFAIDDPHALFDARNLPARKLVP